MVLALRTGIAPSVWEREDPRTVATAWDLLNGQDRPSESDGPVMSG